MVINLRLQKYKEKPTSPTALVYFFKNNLLSSLPPYK
jgi:hypothetical protein